MLICVKKISGIIGKDSFEVTFYGGSERAIVKANALKPYNDNNCQRFNTPKQMRKTDYKVSVRSIEAEMAVERGKESEIDDVEQEVLQPKDIKKKAEKSLKIEKPAATPTLPILSYDRPIVSIDKRKLFRVQKSMIFIISDIKKNLGRTNVDPKYAIKLLHKFKFEILPELTPFMIMKYPQVLEAFKRMRKYKGNLSEWNVSEDDVEKFKDYASKICSLAVELYDSIQAKFVFTTCPFWDAFSKQAGDIKEKYGEIKNADMFKAMTIAGKFY